MTEPRDWNALRERHTKVPSLDPTSFLCDWCEVIWPCEVAEMLALLEEAREALMVLAIDDHWTGRYEHRWQFDLCQNDRCVEYRALLAKLPEPR